MYAKINLFLVFGQTGKGLDPVGFFLLSVSLLGSVTPIYPGDPLEKLSPEEEVKGNLPMVRKVPVAAIQDRIHHSFVRCPVISCFQDRTRISVPLVHRQQKKKKKF